MNINHKFSENNKSQKYYKLRVDGIDNHEQETCYEIFQETNDLLPNLLIGKNVSEFDFENETQNYVDFVTQLSSYFKYESKLLSDVLDTLLGDTTLGYKQLLLAKCLDLPAMEKSLKKFNLNLKNCQHISNDRWRHQVQPSLSEIV